MSLTYGSSAGQDQYDNGNGSWSGSYYYNLESVDSSNLKALWERYIINGDPPLQGPSNGFVISWNSTTEKNECKVESDGNTGAPLFVTNGTDTGNTIEIESGQTLSFGNTSGITTTLFEFTVTSDHLWSTASSGPTVTSIDINVPAVGPLNTGILGDPDYYLDGEVISNDTVLASDISVYKDGVSYANSNITMYGNSFQLTKSGTALYRIECGGKFNVIPFVDRSWVTQLTSSASTRSNNVIRIRDTLATIGLNDIPANAKMYIRSRVNSGSWTAWVDMMTTSNPFYEQGANSTNTRRNPGPGYYLNYYHSDGTGFRNFKFDLNKHSIDGNYEICGWFSSYYYGGSGSSWSEDNEANPVEIGANAEITSYIYSNDSNESRSGCFYDPNFTPNVSTLNEYQLKVDDWVYSNEPEGDAYTANNTVVKVFRNFW